MASGPECKSAYEILGSEPRPIPFISQHFNPFFGGFMGVACVSALNILGKKPIFSGIQRHVLAGAGGAIFGKYIDNNRNERLARKDAVLRHYIELHPEDFPIPERKKFKDILIQWTPVR